MAEELTLRIEKLVYGGDGLGRAGGQAVFVPYTAPGDLARVEVVDRKKNYLRAKLLEVLEPGPGRRAAPCPYFGPCGGCQLQHLDYETQLAAKAGFVREALARIGKIDAGGPVPITGAREAELGYRTRVTAHVAGPSGHRVFGYYAAHSRDVVDIASCPLLVPELDAAWREAREMRDEIASRDVEIAAGDGGASASPPVGNLLSPDLETELDGVRYTFGPGAFFQVNRAMLPALVTRATAGEAGEAAVDLYAGVGLFTIPLTRAFRSVTAVEIEGRATAYARENCRANGATNVRIVAAPVERWLARPTPRPGTLDLALLDPPRGGLGPGPSRDLARLAPRRVVYVSCDPTTLARDLRVLLDEGYRLESIEALDLFPQTFHVESIARLVRDRGPEKP